MSDSSDEDEGESWDETLQHTKRNDPSVDIIDPDGDDIQNMTNEELDELGRDIANNTHLTRVDLCHADLNDHRMSYLFQGLTRSSSIKEMLLYYNAFSIAGVRYMVPFLQNTNNLIKLDLDDNNIQSEGFNLLFRELRDSPIQKLNANGCGIVSIEIDSQRIPCNLTNLKLGYNEINADGCSEIAKLLQGGNATLKSLSLQRNKIDDEGVEILVGALQNSTSLEMLYFSGNSAISKRGNASFLKLVNDISSIAATLRSNHTLRFLHCADDQIQKDINTAVKINLKNAHSLEAVGREKMIQFQLNSAKRAELAELQGVNHSVYSEIDPLHLPEVLALVGRRHGQGELYVALRSSIADVISTVNREQCIEAQMAYHASKLKEHASKLEKLGAELAAIKAARGERAQTGESHNNKRRRKC